VTPRISHSRFLSHDATRSPPAPQSGAVADGVFEVVPRGFAQPRGLLGGVFPSLVVACCSRSHRTVCPWPWHHAESIALLVVVAAVGRATPRGDHDVLTLCAPSRVTAVIQPAARQHPQRSAVASSRARSAPITAGCHSCLSRLDQSRRPGAAARCLSPARVCSWPSCVCVCVGSKKKCSWGKTLPPPSAMTRALGGGS
jgi:hypothetical protein